MNIPEGTVVFTPEQMNVFDKAMQKAFIEGKIEGLKEAKKQIEYLLQIFY